MSVGFLLYELRYVIYTKASGYFMQVRYERADRKRKPPIREASRY